jgi:RHS repeat-associated protein
MSSDVNKLGTFTYSYIGVTGRLQTLTYPGGMTANYSYLPNLQDKRLQQIKNQTSTSVLLSQFDYSYDTEGQLKTWTKNYPGLTAPQRFDLGYDYADQLLTAPLKKTTNNALIRQYTYGYDLASNRTSEQVGNSTTASTPNNVNEITSQSGGTNRTLSYDLNGSLTSNGGTRTFEWDGANRLVAINYTGTTQRTEFTYDGLNRCVKLVEKTGTTVNSTRKFVLCGTEKCEYRNNNGAVQLQLFSRGQYQSNAPYFYFRDHLGSVREMTDASGAVVARYDYDPWGRSTTVIGTNKPDFNFTGLYNHAKSGLDMAAYRFYDPDLGRWLNRDPIGEAGGLNLYGYVRNDPVNLWDPTGENPVAGALIGLGLGGPVGAVIGAGIGTGIVVIGGAAVIDWWRNRPSPPPQVDSTGFPPGYWPGDRGAEEWGRRNDVDPREARGQFHRIKKRCKGSKPTDKFGVNPDTGEVIDPEGEQAGDLEVKGQ